MLQKTSQVLPEDGVDERRNASDIKSDKLTNSARWWLVNRK
jgi:hypothetical protein